MSSKKKESRVMARSEQENQTAVQCLLLPVGSQSLLLPRACVAEVISSPVVEALPGAADWMAGHTVWRGQRIPVVSWAGLHPEMSEVEPHRACAAVMNPMPDTAGAGFWAIHCTADIRPTEIAIETEGGTPPPGLEQRYLAMALTLYNEMVVIPDMTSIGMLLRVL
jgi:chemotaxis signal transduction protein